jgi:hypothetical protein
LFGRTGDDVENNSAVLVRGRNVEEAKLIGAFTVINARDLHWIAGVTQIEKFNPFDDSSGFYVETWNDSLS